MKRTSLLMVLLLGSLVPILGMGETSSQEVKEFRGIILNENCYHTQPTWTAFADEHVLGCAMMPRCYLTDYYLILDGKTAFKMDRRGSLLARRILQKTKHQSNFKVVVTGRMEGETLMVQTMEEVGR